MPSQSKDNTCPRCDGKGYVWATNIGEPSKISETCPDCHGSGQQEDNTGHPTAETPDAQPFDNVSESSRTPGEVGNLYGVKVLPETIEEWEEYAEDLITENERLRGIIERIISGENKPTEPSEQEDKPLTRTEYYEANPPKPEDQLKGIATDSKPTKAETQAMVDEYSKLGRLDELTPTQQVETNKRRAELLEDMGFAAKEAIKKQAETVGNLYGVTVLPETKEEWEAYALELLEENERLRLKAHTKAVLEEYEPALKELTDSKPPKGPEKPHEHQWQTRSNGTFCLGCGGIKLPEDEPSKPDQPHIITDTQLAIEALLATTARAEYARGKVDGAVEEAKLVAKAEAYLKEHGPRNYALKRVVEIKGLKSKGEVKSE